MVDLNYTINPGAMLMPADRLLISGAVSLATNTTMLLTVAMLLATDIGIMGDCPLFLRSIGPKIHWSEKPLGGKRQFLRKITTTFFEIHRLYKCGWGGRTYDL